MKTVKAEALTDLADKWERRSIEPEPETLPEGINADELKGIKAGMRRAADELRGLVRIMTD